MRVIQVGAAVLNQTPLDWEQNLANISQSIQLARQEKVSLLCLPEMCITGYGCEDAFLSQFVQQRAIEILLEITSQTAGMAVSVGLPVAFQNALFNTVCLIADRKILGLTAKQFLAKDGVHYEQRWFHPWPAGKQAEVSIAETLYPLGDLHYDLDGIKVGFEICEDAWVAQRPGARLATEGVDIILNPSASHFAFGKSAIRQRFVLEGSRAFAAGYVYSNLSGNEAGRIIYDGGALIASNGRMVAVGPRLSFSTVSLTSATIDIDLNRHQQAKSGGFSPSFNVRNSDCVYSDFNLPEAEFHANDSKSAQWEASNHHKEEEFTRAVAIGLFDYLRKSKSCGFVVSLSGGADSTAVATLVAWMVKLGVTELGRERFLGYLNYLKDHDTISGLGESDIVSRLLTTVYQSTSNSSETTRQAAQTIAGALHSNHYEFDVDSLVQDYVKMVSTAIDRELTWEKDDLTLQNIQARVRAPGVWMLANIQSALLLSTSNRSEAAVGYATMDGDTSGGVSPVAGIDKAFLLQWLQWMEEFGPAGFDAVKELHCVNQLEPTAELRPRDSHQTDEVDLMPYALLDAVECAAIRDKKSPADVLRTIKSEFTEYDQEQITIWVKRFFRLWSRNQWKRERYAPSFHLDDKNLDPKTWCRFPILSGGFQQELKNLD